MTTTPSNRQRRAAKTASAVVQALESRQLLAASLVADINNGTAASILSSGAKVGAGNDIVLAANGQIWKSDATSANTISIASGFKTDPSPTFTASNGVAFFSITPASSPYTQLWRSDGTAAGTQLMFADTGVYVGTFADSNGTLYFTVSGNNRRELWKSNGTTAGTVKVHTFDPNGQLAGSGFVYFNGRTYFSADAGAAGNGLWSTDGTDAGTTHLVDIYAGNNNINRFAVSNGLLYFAASSLNSGLEPWRTDGTASGTIKIGELSAGASSSFPTNFVALNATTTLFLANGNLYKTAGTLASTTRIFPTGSPYSLANLQKVGSTVFFSGTQYDPGTELWKTDGTDAGTVVVKEINTSGSSNPENFYAVGNTLFFTAVDNTYGQQLWKSNGTSAGTTRVVRYDASPDGYVLGNFFASNAKLFYGYSDPIVGRELFATDGTTSGLLKDLNPTPISSDPKYGANANGKYIVSAKGPNQSVAWWSIDPTTGVATNSGTTNVPVPSDYGYDRALRSIPFKNGLVYSRDGAGMFFTDGTAAGTVNLTIYYAGSYHDPNFTIASNHLFFAADNGSSYYRFLVTDGTTAGTVNLTPNDSFEYISGIATAGPKTFFTARGRAYGSPDQLWQSDGTVAGTFVVQTLPTDINQNYVGNLSSLNGNLYFTRHLQVGNATHTYFNQFNPTTGVITLIHDFSGDSTSFYKPFVAGNRIYFVGDPYSPITHAEVWVSDGTIDGTHLLKDVQSDSTAAIPKIIGAFDDRLLFIANDVGTGSAGRQLWITDGTDAGTIKLSGLLTDIGSAFEGGATVGSTAIVNGQFFFAATDGTNGRELWRTDGTPAGTQRVTDLNPGIADAKPDALAGVGGTLYFAATATDAQGRTDREIWKLPDTFAPIVRSVALDLDASTPTVVVKFSEAIDFNALSNGAQLTNRNTGTVVNSFAFAGFDAATNTARYRFVGTSADANYRFSLSSSVIKDTLGNLMGSDVTNDFFLMAGDVNHDRTVNFDDLIILAQNYGKTGRTFSQGNLDNSAGGKVNFDDLIILAQQYNKTLVAAPPLLAPAATPTTKRKSPVGVIL